MSAVRYTLYNYVDLSSLEVQKPNALKINLSWKIIHGFVETFILFYMAKTDLFTTKLSTGSVDSLRLHKCFAL